jgi:hypothetical protein
VLTAANLAALDISNHYSPKNEERKRRRRTDYIVLHTTEGPREGSLRKVYENGETHYLVDREGKALRIIHKDRIAFHAGTSMWRGKRNVDRFSVSVEVVGYHNGALTSRQIEALGQLISELQSLYDIPDRNVLTHSMVAYGTPNRWHSYAHRGRKRCGMLFALENVRHKLGLEDRPSFDPDVQSGRLVQADPNLAKVLYGDVREQKNAFRLFRSRSIFIISKGRSAWDIARDHYDDPRTLYIFPNGKRFMGDEIKNWKRIPAGTRIEVP